MRNSGSLTRATGKLVLQSVEYRHGTAIKSLAIPGLRHRIRIALRRLALPWWGAPCQASGIMSSRFQSLLCACLVLVVALGWMLIQPSPAGRSVAAPPAPEARQAVPGVQGPIGAAADAPPAPETQLIAGKPPEPLVSIPLPADFLQRILSADEKSVAIALPGGGSAQGLVSLIRRDVNGLLLVQGTITKPEAGRFMFQRQTIRGKAGALAGFIHYDHSETAYQVRPLGENGGPVLVKTTVDAVMCRAYAPPPDAAEVQEIPATHPTDDPIPPDENGIIQLQSLPGAAAVVYLDFDGEERNFDGWGYINAAPSGTSNAQIFEIWQGVCEDFQPFQINVTTVRAVHDAAAPGHRMQVIITPTDTAMPGAGGVAYTGSFNWTGAPVCWAFLTTGKNAVEVISHEVGHTLGLSHDGRTLPYTAYYAGHNGWAPIMGIGYNQPLTQWSKGEYFNANNTEDDLLIISSNNNGVAYRADDHGASFATAPWLDIDSLGAVSGEGIIEANTDRDSFRFSTTGGNATLQINPVSQANLDLKAEILSVTSTLITTIATSNSTTTLSASFSALNLPAGDYLVRVSGSGKGNLITGYSNYASLGSYTITGTITGGAYVSRFILAENSATGTVAGTVQARAGHGGGALSFAISAGNDAGAFAIHPASGQITVANGALLDFEALSSRWDDPAVFELFVQITDNLDYTNETIRVLVELADANEPPVFPMPPPVIIPETLPPGALVATAAATDPDRGDYVSYAIVAGNEDGALAIDPSSGAVTVAAALDYQTTPFYQLTLRATDHLSPSNSLEVPLAISLVGIPEGFATGSVARTFFSGISGTAVADLTENPRFPNNPNSEVILSSFDSGINQGNDYGSTLRGYLIAPASGEYTFWISADETAELRISPDADPANAVVMASVSGPVAPGDWTNQPGQQSAAIELTAGEVYYIEARHKESTGNDHVQVAWQGPGMAAREIIPGRWLAPYRQQHAPWAPELVLSVREAAAAGALVGRVSFIEPNLGEEVASHAITGGNEAGRFTIDSASGEIRVATGAMLLAGETYVLAVSATDDGDPPAAGETTAHISVTGFDENLHAWWRLDEGAGTSISDSSGNGRDGWLAGGGTWIARSPANPALQLNGSDAGFVSTDYDSLSGIQPFTVAVWVKVPASHSAEGVLIQQSDASGYGEPGGYRVSVKSDGRISFSVYGWDLDWYDIDEQFRITSSQAIHDGEWHHVACVRDGETGRIFIDGVESATGSGTIRLLEPGSTTSVGYDAESETAFLNAAVDDVRIYREAMASGQIIQIASIPVFATIPLIGDDATQDAPYNGSLAAAASDPDADDTLTFSKTAGPAWLEVAGNGTLSGMPGNGDVGPNSFTVRVTDLAGAHAEAQLDITVHPPPVVNVSASDTLAAETGPDPGVFTITRSGSTAGDLAVNFTLNGTALNGVDYLELPGSVTIPSGAESVTITVIPTADDLIEGSEAVALTLAEGPYEPGEFSFARLFIRDSNHAPFFLADPVVTPAALAGVAYTGESLADHAGDPNLDDGDTLNFAKIEGPDWLSIALDGTLSGLPAESDLGTHIFTVRVTDAAGLAADGNLQITVTTPSSFESWQLAEFGPQAGDPLVAGELADPDLDGLSNLLEYALGTDPNLPDTARVELEMVDAGGTACMRLTYSINPAATGITMVVEATDDLTDPDGWSDENILIEDVTTARIVVRDTLGGPHRFFRLRVTR